MVISQPSIDTSMYARLPKIELHRHLEGSVRLETLLEIENGDGVRRTNDTMLATRVQVQQGDALTVQNFLSKFEMLRNFYRSKDIIRRVVREAIEDAACEHIRYLELRFAPAALSQRGQFTLEEVIDCVVESAVAAGSDFGVLTRLISTVNRHENTQIAESVARLSAERIADGLVGMDLAGNEADFGIQPFIPIFRRAARDGLKLTIHAGEWGSAENIRLALDELQTQRIGHGVRILEDAAVVRLAREKGVFFEVCLTSNYQTGVVSDIQAHPLAEMLDSGLNVTLNTDDPAISGIDLSQEYRLAVETLRLPVETLFECIVTAAQAAFLSAGQKQLLVDELRSEISALTDVQPCIS